MSGALAFALPPALEASEPPEARGLARDQVRLMVAREGKPPVHARFLDLARFLRPGDLLVVNESATLPAALRATRADGSAVELHLSTPEPPAAGRDGQSRTTLDRAIDPRAGSSSCGADGARFRGARCGERLALAGGGVAELVAPYLSAGRLWIAALELPAPLLDYLDAHGAPIRYSHQPRDWPLADHQTIFSRVPGSAEMPSAGRPFTPRVLARLGTGVGVAPVVLHTGVSSLERGERPYPERFEVPAWTAARVNAARAAGGRVVAVGTTVTRALETVAAPDGTVAPGPAGPRSTITPERGVRAVDGLHHRLARARRQPPAGARGGGRSRAGRGLVRRGGGRGLPLARVRRLSPAAARPRRRRARGQRSASQRPTATWRGTSSWASLARTQERTSASCSPSLAG